MISIETERLHLRNLSQSDADIMVDYRNHEACSRYQRGQRKDYTGIIDVQASRMCAGGRVRWHSASGKHKIPMKNLLSLADNFQFAA